MKNERYKLSFTSASLYLGESVKIAQVFLETADWDRTKEIVMQENILQSRTKSSAIRLYRELAQRMQVLIREQIELLVEGTLEEQKQLLWLAICKRYRFIQEFAMEVLHEKFLTMDYELTELDYDAFFNRKADWHEELDAITKATREKLKQVLFRMLKEAGLISDGHVILPTILSTRLIEVLRNDTPMSYRIFPVSDLNLSGFVENA